MIEGTVVHEGKIGEADVMIRYCQRDDVERLLDFINTVSKEQTYIIFQGEQMTLEEESRYVEGYMKKIEDRKAVKLLAFSNEELIGVCDITPKEKIENHIGVFGLIIKKEWRGKGIGKLIMEKTLQEAEKYLKDLQIITLGVFANNPIAKKMYEKFGFKEYGILPKGLAYKGEYVDHIYMCKLLAKS